MEIFSKNVEFEKLGVKTTLLGLERAVEGTNVITGHKCNKGHKCNNICSQM